jgi:hypothetical protein
VRAALGAARTLDCTLALASGVLASLIRHLSLRRRFPVRLAASADALAGERAELRGIVLGSLPSAVFFCVQGQVTVLLAGICSHGEVVADAGALARFAIALNILFAAINALAVPRFARCREPERLRSLAARYLGWVALCTVAIGAFTAAFPSLPLRLVGGQYARLEPEMRLMGLNLALLFLVHALFALNSARAWIRFTNAANIPLTLCAQAGLLCLIDVSHVRGIVLFSTLSLIPNLATVVVDMIRGLRREAHA